MINSYLPDTGNHLVSTYVFDQTSWIDLVKL